MEPRQFIYKPPNNPIEVIYEDKHILLVNKPSGLLSVPGKSVDHKDCLESRLRTDFPEILLVHRLDHPTSGVMIFARTRHAQRHLGLQFENRQIKKAYLARVWGKPKGNSGHINLPLICDWPNRPKQMVCFERGKSAITNWVLESVQGSVSRLQLHPKTGRSHQLRVHMMSIGHAIVGDAFYASEEVAAKSDRLLLHAHKLSFRHPITGENIETISPVPIAAPIRSILQFEWQG